MSSRDYREGRIEEGTNQRAAGLAPRDLGLNPGKGSGGWPDYQGPMCQEWPGAMVKCRRCGLTVILAMTRRGRWMLVDPYKRYNGRIQLAGPSRLDPSKPLGLVIGQPTNDPEYPHHGATCARMRRQNAT